MNIINTIKQLCRTLFDISVEPALPESKLYQSLEIASSPYFGFYFMLALAGIIATLGLLYNSAATIIGAMIVAPLMNPIVALAFALVTGRRQWAIRSMFSIANGAFLTIFIAWLLTELLTVTVVDSEVIARTNPTLLDLGVAIAAGAAGGFVNTRQNIASSIAGVAIAVALVPPLSVIGIGLALGKDAIPGIGLIVDRNGIAYGATLLFLTNLVAIVLSSGLVFAVQGYGSLKKAVLGLGGWVAFAAIIFLPLGRSFQELLIRNRVRRGMTEYWRSNPEELAGARLISYSVDLREDYLFVENEGLLLRDFITEEIQSIGDFFPNI